MSLRREREPKTDRMKTDAPENPANHHYPRRMTFSVTQRDVDITNWLTEFLGTTRSDAIRTAIRAFAGQMGSVEKELGRPRGS